MISEYLLKLFMDESPLSDSLPADHRSLYINLMINKSDTCHCFTELTCMLSIGVTLTVNITD